MNTQKSISHSAAWIVQVISGMCSVFLFFDAIAKSIEESHALPAT